MRIVVDLQGAQGVNRNRGIGRYSLSFAKSLVRCRKGHDIVLALNGLFPDTVEPIRAHFEGLLPQENIRVWPASGTVKKPVVKERWHHEVARLTREAFLTSLNPDIIHISSLFEDDHNTIISIGHFVQDIPTSVTVYDFIPLRYSQVYLENPQVKASYYAKLKQLKKADLFLAISEASRQDCRHYLDCSAARVVNVSAACDVEFHPVSIPRDREREIYRRYRLQRSFILYTGGIDHRKNIEGLIRAYAALPREIRANNQLVIVCAIAPEEYKRLKSVAVGLRLHSDDVILTGFVSEEDLLTLYNLCKVFIFPSKYEGFGLPVLEAMSCGRAVIGSNTSSIPEVIGLEEALFDPENDKEMTASLARVLTEDAFRRSLEEHGIHQAAKFSWDRTAHRAIAAFEKVHAQSSREHIVAVSPCRKLKLAYISPLLPERSGISEYSSELLPELSHYYDIDVIVNQDVVTDSWVNTHCQIRDVEWFKTQVDRFDRVLYHFGNSSYHSHMFTLLEEIPGIVVLHDFYLSGIIYQMDFDGFTSNGWARELYRSHGYKSVYERFYNMDIADVVWKYPSNISVLRHSSGTIVHSEYSRDLAKDWYHTVDSDSWACIPHLRVPVVGHDRLKARQVLKIDPDRFVLCCFGVLGPLKLNQRLLGAWLRSNLAKDNNCILIFVGDDYGEYGQKLQAAIQRSGLAGRIFITGWVDRETFGHYLMASDIAVQLRSLSRGETSGTVLDCMNHGLPTIVNAHGSMGELPDNVVWKLPDVFNDDQLIEAMESLWRDPGLRRQLGEQAAQFITINHAPQSCASQYYCAIEEGYGRASRGVRALTKAIASCIPKSVNDDELISIADVIGRTIAPPLVQRQFFLDISELVQRDVGTGIQRVVRNMLKEFLLNPPTGFKVEPVYATVAHGYCYARKYSFDFIGCPSDIMEDEPIEYYSGDFFLGLDLNPQVVPAQRNFFYNLRRDGVQVQFVVYDLLPVLMPLHFVNGAFDLFSSWLQVVGESDGALCISKAVADELTVWMDEHIPERIRPFNISWFHLGVDEKLSTSFGMSDGADDILNILSERIVFLMVGTLEPRKGHAQVLADFEDLWAGGLEISLVIVGKAGWMVGDLIEKIEKHPENGNRLFWIRDVTDEFLEKIYGVSTCLLAASEGEGFGLPLVEAAQHELSIIARDIPVFREVAGNNAFYFGGNGCPSLGLAIKEWLTLYEFNKHPTSTSISRKTWKQSYEQLLSRIGLRLPQKEQSIKVLQLI